MFKPRIHLEALAARREAFAAMASNRAQKRALASIGRRMERAARRLLSQQFRRGLWARRLGRAIRTFVFEVSP